MYTYYEIYSGKRYLYTLGPDEDPAEQIEKEQSNGFRRVHITKVEGGVRERNFLVGSDEVVPESEGYEDEYEEEGEYSI